MYLRLWWKDARQLWSIWVFVALAAAAGQWLALNYYGPHVRQGTLLVMALAWSVLYAVVVGSAAFAGERETGTLKLLDILPAARPVVWAGKFSFALITTMALTGLLFTMAAFSTEHVGYFDGGSLLFKGDSKSLLAVSLGLVVLVALAWGLFWSSILSNALTAAIATAGSTAICMIYLMAKLEEVLRWLRESPKTQIDIGENPFVIFEIVVILATLVASNLLFTRGSRQRRLRLPFQFQSPIVMTPAEPEQRRPVALRRPSPVAQATEPRVAEATTVDQLPRRSRLAEARALIWETRQEGATTWSLLAAIGIALPLPFYLAMGNLEPGLVLLLDTIIALVAGINVFGMENRGRTQRFLTHHGARPGLVWLVKLAVWCVGLALIWGPQAIAFRYADLGVNYAGNDNWIRIFSVIPLGFAVALLCGMTISRGLTAVVIAMVMTLALELPLLALVRSYLLLDLGLFVIPVALLVVSWAWSGDWLLDWPAPGRWLRLGSLLTVMCAVLLGSYTGNRAWSVPDIGPIAPPRAWITAESDPLPAGRNAADLYRQAFAVSRFPLSDLTRNRDALDLVRRAAAYPDCWFLRPEQLTLSSSESTATLGWEPMSNLGRLVIQSARDRLDHGDLDAAWKDLITLFRIVRHQSDGAAISRAMAALVTEREALDLAMEWAVASRQTPERIRSALAAIRDLPKMTPADEVVRADALLTEKTLNLPAQKLEKELEWRNGHGLGRTGEFWTTAWLDWLTTPWERARARRVNRLIATADIEKAALENWQRDSIRSRLPNGPETDFPYDLSSTPLAKLLSADMNVYLAPHDLNEVGRRALMQVMALRAWQLRHNGQFPDSLDKLVPEELPSLPIDPYLGRIFGYVRSEGQPLVPLGKALTSAGVGTASKVATTGYWLLYSVGRDKYDNRALITQGAGQQTDIVFPIPPVQSDGAVDLKR